MTTTKSLSQGAYDIVERNGHKHATMCHAGVGSPWTWIEWQIMGFVVSIPVCSQVHQCNSHTCYSTFIMLHYNGARGIFKCILMVHTQENLCMYGHLVYCHPTSTLTPHFAPCPTAHIFTPRKISAHENVTERTHFISLHWTATVLLQYYYNILYIIIWKSPPFMSST